MTNLTIFDPFREITSIRAMLDQAFDNFLLRRGEIGGDWLAMDMYQTDDDVIVKAVLPGMKPEDINISVSDGMLTIHGEMREEKVEQKARYHLRERRVGSFSRSVPLPAPVVTEKAEAKYEDGILTLILPKTEETKPKTITVKVK